MAALLGLRTTLRLFICGMAVRCQAHLDGLATSFYKLFELSANYWGITHGHTEPQELS
jgi:hypothetical protein